MEKSMACCERTRSLIKYGPKKFVFLLICLAIIAGELPCMISSGKFPDAPLKWCGIKNNTANISLTVISTILATITFFALGIAEVPEESSHGDEHNAYHLFDPERGDESKKETETETTNYSNQQI